MGIIWTIIIGFVAGVIAKFIMPGKDPGGIIITIILGIVGAFLGTFLGRYLLGQGPEYSAGWIMSIIGAIIVLLLYRLIMGRRTVV